MVGRGLRSAAVRDAADTFTLTDEGRAVLEVLMMRAATRAHPER